MNNKNPITIYSRIFNFYFIIACLILIIAAIFCYVPNNPIISIATHVIEESAVKTKRLKPGINYLELRIKKGDTISSILQSAGIPKEDAKKLTEISKKYINSKKLAIGQKLSIVFDHNEENDFIKLQSLKIKTSNFKELELSRKVNGDFAAKEIDIKLKKYLVRAKAPINNSILGTANKIGIPTDSMLEVIKAYSYDIDFQRDIQPNDEIDIFYERFYDEQGEFSHDGKILSASLNLADRTLNLFNYTDSSNNSSYYNIDGENVRKELLKTPINVTRISSGFGMRKHPILGFSKMHAGVDFAAPIGTPIFAAGNGVIEEIGRKGAYGNYIRLRHNSSYATAYAHASSFAKGLKRGQPVKQGDVIAYVGTTGRSTGAHLHYEVLLNNKQINPLKMKLPSGHKLTGLELASFKNWVKNVKKLSDKLPDHAEIDYDTLEKKG